MNHLASLLLMLAPLVLALDTNLTLSHTTRGIPPELAVDCKQLRLPSTLCSSCPLKSFDSEGNFAQNLDAFELSGDACQGALRRYVDLNPCDTVRARQINNQDVPSENRGLEIFMYAVCETCCDCIPIGAKAYEFDQREKDKTLLTSLRGNCVMHYLFDVCKILPNVADVARPAGEFLGVKKPVCEIIREWTSRGFGRDWELDPEVDQLPKDAKRYLSRLTKFSGCRQKQIWQSCIPMERARGRL